MIENENCEILPPETAGVLSRFVKKAPFLYKYVLVGGSALAFHCKHRKSEDLDFFTYQKKDFNKKEIRDFLSSFTEKEIVNETDEQIDLLCDRVKVTFFDAAWDFLSPPTEAGGEEKQLYIADLKSLAAMKTNTLFLRARYRDYYDLYHIVKYRLTLDQVYREAKKVIQGLTEKLFYIALTYLEDIEDDSIAHLDPVESVKKEEIRLFFEAKIKSQPAPES